MARKLWRRQTPFLGNSECGTYGEVAYRAYREHMEETTTYPYPRWSALTDESARGWELAARAAIVECRGDDPRGTAISLLGE